MMKKRFNITGSCNPERHYMVDTEKRFDAVKDMIDTGEYFTINRARQYGKTTMLQTIRRRLSDRYLVIKTSFEGVGDDSFNSVSEFVNTFCGLMVRFLKEVGIEETVWSIFDRKDISSFDELSNVITLFCQNSPKLVVLLIDEVDKSSDNQLFLNFIGMLRNKYLDRETGHGLNFPQCCPRWRLRHQEPQAETPSRRGKEIQLALEHCHRFQRGYDLPSRGNRADAQRLRERCAYRHGHQGH